MDSSFKGWNLLALKGGEACVDSSFNPLTTNDTYIRHGCPHFFHKAIIIYMGGLPLDPSMLFPCITMVGKELIKGWNLQSIKWGEACWVDSSFKGWGKMGKNGGSLGALFILKAGVYK